MPNVDANSPEDINMLVKIQSLTRRKHATKRVQMLKDEMISRSGEHDVMALEQESSYQHDDGDGDSSEGGKRSGGPNSADGNNKQRAVPIALTATQQQQQRRATNAAINMNLIDLPTEEEVESYMDDPCASTARQTRKLAETNRGKKHPFQTVDFSKGFDIKPSQDNAAGLQAFLRKDKSWW